ncbi:LamG-like jellyroll fold domain-containing protein [Actinoplanes sp. NPDC051411]|uniref:LamG-like jellyroll fold domain-containing protein n=1 Tax=Actinoplanes sp. NPDC051411 TaxID=3155522 RepID=UPI003446DBB8
MKLRILALVLVTLTLGPSARASTTTLARRPALPRATSDTVRFTFDGRSPLADVSGHGHDLSPVSRHGGALATAAHGDGSALVFPPPCHDEPCPRIALRAPTAADLDPGTRPIRWGAAVKLAADQTTKGENVVQKGYSASGSQYKLQVDGLAGDPSCVMVDDQRPEIRVAMSSAGVADGRWHTLECRRSGTRLVVLVDGEQRGSTTVPADLSVHNRIPLSVGGKGSFTNNDQFQGELDDIWVAIG